MRIGLLSDTHDRLDAVRALMQRMAEENVAVVLHAGDYCAPFTVRAITAFQIPLLGVFGNNDGDREALTAAAQSGIGSELYASPHSFEVGGKQLLVVHDLADVHERSIAQHQVVVHGGTHTAEMRSRGDTLIVNPGEGCGWLYGEPTGAILDLDTSVVEFIKLTGPEWKLA
jgi:putative phosphoesterase